MSTAARASYGGNAVPLGIINHNLRRATIKAAESGEQEEFSVFVMPAGTEDCRFASITLNLEGLDRAQRGN
jgi:hypothetical protein